MIKALEENLLARRVARRLGVWQPGGLRAEAPPRPLGAKLEVLYACNLRCPFCYTDAPRHTLARTPSLDDEQWLGLAEECIELGIMEAVITGGEPLMRAELVVELADRFARAGIGLTLNTNGWYLDDAVADRLSRVPGLTVDVSIDGATAETHDRARGVPGSWRRAVEAVDRLLARGIGHQVVHVVTPDNVAELPVFLDRMWALGVESLRVTPVAEIGAAARRGRWRVGRASLEREMRRFEARTGGAVRTYLQYGNVGLLARRDEAAPAAFLVRPNGGVLTDSLQPFRYGNALSDGLAECWGRIREGWRNPAASRWARSFNRSSDVRRSELVPYLSDEVDVGAGSQELPPTRRHDDDPLPRHASPPSEPDGGEEEAGRLVEELVLARAYRLADVRLAGGGSESFARRRADGRVVRLNAVARLIAEALDGATAADALDRLVSAYPDVGGERLRSDGLGAIRALVGSGVVEPAGATEASLTGGGGTPDLPGAEPGSEPLARS